MEDMACLLNLLKLGINGEEKLRGSIGGRFSLKMAIKMCVWVCVCV